MKPLLSSAEAPRPDALDRVALQRQTGDDPVLRREILALFTAQAEGVRARMAEGGGASAADLHRLKGSALAVGAAVLAAAIDELERSTEGHGSRAAKRVADCIEAACRFAAKLGV